MGERLFGGCFIRDGLVLVLVYLFSDEKSDLENSGCCLYCDLLCGVFTIVASGVVASHSRYISRTDVARYDLCSRRFLLLCDRLFLKLALVAANLENSPFKTSQLKKSCEVAFKIRDRLPKNEQPLERLQQIQC